MTRVSPRVAPRPNAEPTTFGSLNRSQLMARVRSTGNRTTELRTVALLREYGITGWRRHGKLPGKPDFTWRLERVVLFVDGCFWHGHRCGKKLAAKTNPEFWRVRIATNKTRDRRNSRQLRRQGWKVVRFWECELRRAPAKCIDRLLAALGRSSSQLGARR
jgi:DNA mismatch endonuclease (patch repair protein)